MSSSTDTEHVIDIDADVVSDVPRVAVEGEPPRSSGPTEAGKVTSVKTVSGLIRPRLGHVRYLGTQAEVVSP